MPMSPMTPKTPPAAAFRLLSDLNEFTALPQHEREELLAAWAAADEERAVVLERAEVDRKAAEEDRAAAAEILRLADVQSMEIREVAAAEGKAVKAAANKQAEEINETVRESVATAEGVKEAALEIVAQREHEITARELDCEVREANAFQQREDAVSAREEAATVAMKEAEALHALAQSTKDGYDALIAEISAVTRRAPA